MKLANNALLQLKNGTGENQKLNTKKNRFFYCTRHLTQTNCRHLFKNKDNFVYIYKTKKYEHINKTLMHNDFQYLLKKRKKCATCPSVKKIFYLLLSYKRQ